MSDAPLSQPDHLGEPDWPVIHAFLHLQSRYGLTRSGFECAPVVTLIALDEFDAPMRLATQARPEPAPIVCRAHLADQLNRLGHPAFAPREAWIDWTVVYAAAKLARLGVEYEAFRRAPWAHLYTYSDPSALECLADGFQPLLPAQAAVAKRLRAAERREGGR